MADAPIGTDWRCAGARSLTPAVLMPRHVSASPPTGRTGSRCATRPGRNVCEPAFMSAPTAATITREWKRDNDPGDAISRNELAALLPLASHRRQQLVAAIIGDKFSAALPSDRSTARRGRGICRDTERAGEPVGALAYLAAGEGRAGG